MFIPVSDSNNIRKTPWITSALIIINVVIHLWFTFGSDLSYEIPRYGMVPWEISHMENVTFSIADKNFPENEIIIKRTIHPLLSIITSIFVHSSFMHISMNMLFLWVFGRAIENELGMIRYIVFYMIGGICASLIHFIFNFNDITTVVGASGAVSAVMGGYLVTFPVSKIRTLVFIFFFITFIDIPAAVFLIIWFIFQFSAAPEVAWLAHAGGFLTGIFILKKIKDKKGEYNDQSIN